MSKPYRTATGQTGPTAYVYEATQIANALRELDERAARLAAIMVDELPDDVEVKVGIPSDRYPDATSTADRDSLARMLPMMGNASDAKTLASFAWAMLDPEHRVAKVGAE
jgi:hypothetical protein